MYHYQLRNEYVKAVLLHIQLQISVSQFVDNLDAPTHESFQVKILNRAMHIWLSTSWSCFIIKCRQYRSIQVFHAYTLHFDLCFMPI